MQNLQSIQSIILLKISCFHKNNTDTSVNTAIVMKNESFDNDDEVESEDDEFNKIFKSVEGKEDDNKNSLLIQQSILFNSHGDKKMLTTSGEKGAFLIKIEITNTKYLSS